MDIFKTILPIITLFLGIFLTPFIERLKRNKEQDRLFDSVKIELSDNLSSITNDIHEIYHSISTRILKSDGFVHLSLPLEMEFTLLNKHLSDIYPILSRDQRRGMRVILAQEKTINDKRDEIIDKFKKSNNECLAIEQTLLHSYFCVYYILNGLVNQKERYQQGKEPTKEVVKKAAQALELSYPIDVFAAQKYLNKIN